MTKSIDDIVKESADRFFSTDKPIEYRVCTDTKRGIKDGKNGGYDCIDCGKVIINELLILKLCKK
jgi:hypothetical protein